MSTTSPAVWIVFNLFVIIMIILDALVLSPKNKEIKMKQALILSGFWISLALLFNLGIYFWLGKQLGLEFLTGYVIEMSLSVDNLFVIMLIFTYFKVPQIHQRKVLFWGILGAQVMRAVFILLGVALLERFHWLIYIFGAFLVFSGIKLFFEKDKEVNPENNVALKLFRKIMPVTDHYVDGKFTIMKEGRRWATPLLVVLVVIETTDLIFALDSIPAVLAITKDPFIAYSSNIFAILGLRAMYFALSGLMVLFHHLHYGLGIILAFVGFKMLTEGIFHMPIAVALGVIVLVLATSVVTSIMFPAKDKHSIT